MKIVYLHGFGSKFDPESAKCATLAEIGTVSGPNLDYTQGFDAVKAKALEFVLESKCAVLVGTSMGGFLAAEIGALTGIPFVAINPATTPAITLKKFLGDGIDFEGKPFTMSEATCSSYPEINTSGKGLVLLDMADEVLPAAETKEELGTVFPVVTYDGGNHRFQHLPESLGAISEFLAKID